ncbi:zf-HC2 domain-containing protein [Paraburkholderia madseniana]|uniref:anti-sigma factor family protein n=1 Tax=Paraburkholderia madseniana TaxID=2599607 RepID=UPI0015594962|nr:zf-HC2 domain-containing protein [Paraburkholderia madseniana]NPT68547.1 hypothetical protein [Paraburkholderia madseniana]
MNIATNGELAHLRAWELLPWIVNGRASDAERSLVDAHLRDCERCRAELAFQRTLHAGMAPLEGGGPDLERGLDHLWQRFDEAEQWPAAMPWNRWAVPRGRVAALAYGLAAVVLLQAGGLAVLGVQYGHDSRPASYRTLSEPDAATGRATIRLAVDPAMSVGQLQALLVPLHLQIVGGTGDNGVYSLAPVAAPGNLTGQRAVLRAARGVRFVEPVEEGNGAS